MVEAAEDRGGGNARATRRSFRREVARAIWRLHVEAAMRPAMVVADVLAEHMLRVTLAAHDDVVQAVSAKSANHSFAKGVRLWGSRRRGQRPDAEPSNAQAEC